MAEEKKKGIKTKVKRTIAIDPDVDSTLDKLSITFINAPSTIEITISYKMVNGEVTKDEFNTGGELNGDQQSLSKTLYQAVIASFKGLKDGKITVKYSTTLEVIS